MCGIAGIFDPAGNISPVEAAAAARMTAAQFHRGPDDSGAFCDTHVALGHRRLSIIDLSDAGRQPLGNEDGTIQVVCNGEIYNYRDLTKELVAAGHRFASSSDCEVLAHGYEQWGMDGLLRRLRGMFAFLLYDARRTVCYAARDRLGIKPLYYSQSKAGRVAFASEVRALTDSGCTGVETDPDAVSGFLLLGSVPNPLTWRKGIACLEPGNYLEVSSRSVRHFRYWSPGDAPALVNNDLRSTLDTALRQHLISDAPLGIFLSSGVDSTGLVALARRAGQRVRTLTVVFDEASFNEDTRAAAEHFDTDHTEVKVTGDDFMREIPRYLAALDQPTADGLNTYFVSKAAHESGLKTVLSGLGGDEVFRGYRHYHWLAKHHRAISRFSHLPPMLRASLAQASGAAGIWLGNENLGRLRSLGAGTLQSLYLTLRGFFAPDVVSRLTGRAGADVLSAIPQTMPGENAAGDTGDIRGFQILELNRYLHDQLLRDADVFSMACSLEIRVPYLDHEVLEIAMAAPPRAYTKPGVNKPLLVDAIGDERVTEAARRPKSGFTFPLDTWMRRHSAELRERALQADLDRREILRLWGAFDAGHMNAVRAWALVVMGELQRS